MICFTVRCRPCPGGKPRLGRGPGTEDHRSAPQYAVWDSVWEKKLEDHHECAVRDGNGNQELGCRRSAPHNAVRTHVREKNLEDLQKNCQRAARRQTLLEPVLEKTVKASTKGTVGENLEDDDDHNHKELKCQRFAPHSAARARHTTT